MTTVRETLPLVQGNPRTVTAVAGAHKEATAADLLNDLKADALATLEPVERAFDTSWKHLGDERRHLFAALGRFAGESFSREAVLAMVGDGAKNDLARLVGGGEPGTSGPGDGKVQLATAATGVRAGEAGRGRSGQRDPDVEAGEIL